MGGLGTASAYAQAPTFSPPGLPPIPGIPSSGSSATAPIPESPGMGIVSPPKLDTSRVEPPPNPSLSDLTKVPGTPIAAQDPTKPSDDDALADLPPPPTPESGDVVAGSNPKPTTTAPVADATAEAATGAPPPVPPSLPGGVSLPPPPITANNVVIPATTLPEIDSASNTETKETPKLKSWQTTLKPVSTAYNIKFNYRRAVLPEAIYRTSYSRDNSHLPVRVTRDDYVYMLFERAAVNDINGTRALLNAGTDINATNTRGETPLMVARRFGAMDTASLLMARGAR